MSAKNKFLLWIGGFGVISIILPILFMQTDYAKKELAFFRQYPYREMASRQYTRIEEKQPVQTSSKPIGSPPPKADVILENLSPLPQTAQASPIKVSALQMESEKKKISPLIRKKPSPIDKKNASPADPEFIQDTILPKTQTVTIHSSEVANWRHEATLGYLAYEQKKYTAAIKHFEQALSTAPHHKDILLQLAYSYKILGINEKATYYFKRAMDQMAANDILFALKREVEQLENRFDISGYMIFREKSAKSRQIAGPDLSQSQMGVELSYQPPDFGFDNGRKVQIYGRVLSATKEGSLTIDDDSLQGGLGVRWKPLSQHNLVLSAERLIRIGDFSRNDWMLRAGYSHDHNSDYQDNKSPWWSWNLYLDAALINPAKPDIFLTMQATGGLNMRLSDGLILQPRLTSHLNWQKDRFHTTSLIEAGPGLNIRFYFNDTKYEAYRSHIDLTVEYRLKLSGTSSGGSGWVASFKAQF